MKYRLRNPSGKMPRTHCPQGHRIYRHNIYWAGKSRDCLACRRIRSVKKAFERSGNGPTEWADVEALEFERHPDMAADAQSMPQSTS